MASSGKKYILRIDSYEGDSTSREQTNSAVGEMRAQDCELNKGITLWAVISIEGGNATIVDDGYRSYEEAKAAWWEAA